MNTPRCILRLNKLLGYESCSAAAEHLKLNHWTQQQAATALNVTLSYLNRVLNGEMKSQRLLNAVMKLAPPTAPDAAGVESHSSAHGIHGTRDATAN